MAFQIGYTGTEDGRYVEVMLGAVAKWEMPTLEVEWDTSRKDPSTATGVLTDVADGFIVLDETVRIPVGAVLNIEISDETS